jgi:hypothetical protein
MPRVRCVRALVLDGVLGEQERLGIDRLEFRLGDCDDVGDSAGHTQGALHRDRHGGRETFSKKLGRFLKDPSVWCAGFQVRTRGHPHDTASAQHHHLCRLRVDSRTVCFGMSATC